MSAAGIGPLHKRYHKDRTLLGILKQHQEISNELKAKHVFARWTGIFKSRSLCKQNPEHLTQIVQFKSIFSKNII